MNEKINNLVNYFNNLNWINSNGIKGTNFSRIINRKTIDFKEDEFKKQIYKFSEDDWINPVDILIMSINSIEKITKEINLQNCNKYSILWIMCLLNSKLMSSHDHEHSISLEFLSNLGGFQLEDYIYFEQILLEKLDWKLEISNADYERLVSISNKY